MSRLATFIVISILYSSCERVLREDLRFYKVPSFKVGSVRTDEAVTLRDVHLDGAGLLNREVTVVGTVETVGNLGTFIVIGDSKVRMLVDTSSIFGLWQNRLVAKGKSVVVLGVVQTGEKGHVFLSAKAIKLG
jgi:hypothetical protein